MLDTDCCWCRMQQGNTSAVPGINDDHREKTALQQPADNTPAARITTIWKDTYRGAFEEIIDSSGLAGHVPVIVSCQIAHGTVQPLKLLHILWQPAHLTTSLQKEEKSMPSGVMTGASVPRSSLRPHYGIHVQPVRR